jgi:site-specific DNA recombinase
MTREVTPVTTPITAAAYARISNDPGNDQKGVARQIQDCAARIEREPGWVMVGEFVDNDLSATSGKVKRPQFEALMAAVRAGRVKVIVVYMTGRLIRNRRERLDTFELLAEQGVKIICTGGTDIDLSTPAGRLVANMLGEADTYEVEQLSARVSRYHQQAAEEGRPHGGRSYGYVANPSAPTHHRERIMQLEEASLICGLAWRVFRGDSYRSILHALDESGIPPLRGERWSLRALKSILTNPAIAGRRRYMGKDVGPATWDWIIEPSKHAALLALMDKRTRAYGWSNRHVHLLSGLMLCGKCLTDSEKPREIAVTGRRVLESKDKRRRVYVCPDKTFGGCRGLSRDADFVDAYVEETVIRLLGEPGVITGLIVAGSPSAEETLKIANEIEACKARAARIGTLMAEDDPDDEITAIARKSALSKVRSDLDTLRLRQQALNNSAAVGGLLDVEDIAYHWQHVMTLAEKRTVIGALVKVTLLPVGKGRTATTEHIRIERRTH